jgi:hypothetical protein
MSDLGRRGRPSSVLVSYPSANLPASMPSLDELAREPDKAAGLPAGVRSALLVRAAAVLAALAAHPAPRIADQQPDAPDQALGIVEAATRLGMKQDTLYRKWRDLGLGYRDVDGRVKFSARALERYIDRKAVKTS